MVGTHKVACDVVVSGGCKKIIIPKKYCMIVLQDTDEQDIVQVYQQGKDVHIELMDKSFPCMQGCLERHVW